MKNVKMMSAVIVAVILAAGICGAEEEVFLKSGEQYRCEVERIAAGVVTCRVGEEEREFPLGEVHRIEFEREREFDGIETSEGLTAAGEVFAKALSVDTEELKAKYPQAGYVVLRDDIVIRVNSEGGGYKERTLVWRIMEQRGAGSAIRQIYYFPGIERVDIVYGITVGPGGEVARVSDAALKDEAVHPAYPEYNYRHRVRFTMKNAVPGATLFLKTRVTQEGRATVEQPLTLEKVFWGDEPAVRQTVRLAGDIIALSNCAVAASNGLEKVEGEDRWVVEDAPQIFWESLMPPYGAFAPRLTVCYPRGDWKGLAKVFRKRVDYSGKTGEAGGTAREIYDKVRRDIRLVNVAWSDVPAAPAGPAEVMRRGFGNAVEKGLLLEALLKAAGYEATAVMARYRGRAPLAEGVGMLSAFNTVIVRLVEEDGGVVWLQCDGAKKAYGEIGDGTQGAAGLDLDTGELVRVPARDAEMEGTARTAEVELAEDGSAVVREEYRLTGGAARAMRWIGDMSEEEARRWAESFVGGELPGVDLVAFTHSDFAECNDQEHFEVEYRVPALGTAAGDYLICKLPNARYSPVEVGRSTRQWGLFWLGPLSARTEFTVKAPEGYEAYATDAGAKLSGEGWELEAGFSQEGEGRQVVYRERWRREALEAGADAYQAYREALITRGILRNEMIVFEKKSE